MSERPPVLSSAASALVCARVQEGSTLSACGEDETAYTYDRVEFLANHDWRRAFRNVVRTFDPVASRWYRDLTDGIDLGNVEHILAMAGDDNKLNPSQLGLFTLHEPVGIGHRFLFVRFWWERGNPHTVVRAMIARTLTDAVEACLTPFERLKLGLSLPHEAEAHYRAHPEELDRALSVEGLPDRDVPP